MKALLKKLFARQSPQYGHRIFRQRTWLAKQVDEAIYKRAFNLD
jgi:hypothetical protein